MYAIVETGGKQYRVKEGDRIRVELLKAEEGSTVTLDRVLLVSSDDSVKVGSPVLEGAKVTAKVLGHGKEDKVVVFKYRRKKNYRRFRGHRQHYTDLLVEGISL
ncbi:50S ribosomal protein L21 [Thermanaerovibrio acidaminovorans]|jgi:large subunit ribosomal protein L21|uniref:Large ribosomal subunit protein bL21 n=1 Tax=Thermanaerovibrio acidaminovorans (strain ATCC 49978 / DSM 6589 / Su883) TaxID=525903 RepID=D1BA28_THEAS|nr:50S ribosomal protein L21 [Thermanaerovibrio acidaminovorans]ACZ19131.1 ribosomal protein L21 [Thermanaerovibrio acidaminovorans DSM 6589]